MQQRRRPAGAGRIPSARRLLPLFTGCAVFFAVTASFTAPAAAELRVCNNTGATVSLAIGYPRTSGLWVSEGWWPLQGMSCGVLVDGPLTARYYYLYAIDTEQGGEWGGEAYLCTEPQEFTIEGDQDCIRRGYNRTGFFEVDTRQESSWTVYLNGEGESGDAAP